MNVVYVHARVVHSVMLNQDHLHNGGWQCCLVCRSTTLVLAEIKTIGLAAMTFCKDIHGAWMMIATDFGDPLTFTLMQHEVHICGF